MEEPAQFAGDLPLEAADYVDDPGLIIQNGDGPGRRNHGKIDINRLDADAKNAIMDLMHAFSMEVGILKAQVTFDFEPDQPPTVHVITAPTDEAIDRWFS